MDFPSELAGSARSMLLCTYEGLGFSDERPPRDSTWSEVGAGSTRKESPLQLRLELSSLKCGIRVSSYYMKFMSHCLSHNDKITISDHLALPVGDEMLEYRRPVLAIGS